MRYSHASLDMVDHYRLGICTVCCTCRSVSDMTYRNLSFSKLADHLRPEDLVNLPKILMSCEYAVVIYNYSGTFLSAVLE